MYTGNVKVGGSADVHELPKLIVSKLAVGPYNNNAYVLRCRRTGAQVLIDAPSEADRLLTLIGNDGVELVITTHSHHDHWGALAEVVAATGAMTAAHLLDAPQIPVPTDVLLADQDLMTSTSWVIPPAPLHCFIKIRTARRIYSPAIASFPVGSATPKKMPPASMHS